jgi:type VI secretion system secreted protein Hcp
MPAAEGREPSMAFDMFLLLDTIPGESVDRMFKGQTELHAITSGLHNPVMVGSGISDAKPRADQLVVTKWVDSTSPLLAKALLTGGKLATGRISFRKAGDTPDGLVFLTMDLRPVFVNNIQSVTSGTDDRPVEQVTLAFGEITWTYTRQKPDGTTSQTRYGWSFVNNSPI